MKLKCIDGKVRSFTPSHLTHGGWRYIEAKCDECGFLFGVHDTKFVKEQWKKHICKIENKDNSNSTNSAHELGSERCGVTESLKSRCATATKLNASEKQPFTRLNQRDVTK